MPYNNKYSKAKMYNKGTVDSEFLGNLINQTVTLPLAGTFTQQELMIASFGSGKTTCMLFRDFFLELEIGDKTTFSVDADLPALIEAAITNKSKTAIPHLDDPDVIHKFSMLFRKVGAIVSSDAVKMIWRFTPKVPIIVIDRKIFFQVYGLLTNDLPADIDVHFRIVFDYGYMDSNAYDSFVRGLDR